MNEMILEIDECEELSLIKNKTNFIIPTSQAEIKFLMWAVFSVLLRSKIGNFTEHINVVINGADIRTGDPSLQDKKQKFLEDLRNLNWRNSLSEDESAMPLTVMRVWSRLGAEQSFESVLPWVHTDSYVYMHDDAIWLEKNWEENFKKELYQKDVGIICGCDQRHTMKDFYLNEKSITEYNNKLKLNFPHIVSPCIASKKPLTTKLGIKWSGYHFEKQIELESKKIDYISHDIGSWANYIMKKNGYKTIISSCVKIHHFGAMSWLHRRRNPELQIKRKMDEGNQHIQKIEEEIKNIPEYWKLYNKYL